MIDFQKSYQRTDFISFLKDFLPEETDFTQKDIVKENYWKFIQKVDIIGENKFLGIKILEVEQRSENDPRISITKEIFKLMPDNRIKKALVVFKNPKTQSYRLSLVTVGYELSEDGKIVKSVSDAKRYSFLCGVGEKVKTVRDNLIKKGAVKDFSDLLERFNVEVVRKEFFNNYLDLYVRLYREIIKDENFTKLLKSQGVDIVSFAKTLLGKLVFLYFIQKKGWLGVSRGGEYGKDGDKDFMRSIWDDFKNNKESLSIEKKGYFYNDYLEWLFYEGLNRDRRDSEDYFVNLQMKVPYLNGGLFKEDYKDWEKGTSKISNEIFSNKTEKYEGDGILDIFDTYNFTIDEDDLYDREVAVDPEMLGKIFEKMISISSENIDTILEEYNKNESSGKKKKLEIDNVLNKKLGAFYTPREIVHYMTKESLIAYLVNNLKGKKEEKKENEAKIRRLFELKEQFLVTKIEITESTFDMLASCITEIDELLKKVKVLDPAVGSGAFPMGLLHEIATIRYYIYGVFYETFKSPHPNPLPEGEGIEQFFTEKDTGKKAVSMYKIKRDVIQNNIYGVDISAGAIEIARLRFWLSLVVDEETPEPLPNFEFKFVCANTLIPLEEEQKQGQLELEEVQKELNLDTLKNYMSKFYNAQTNKDKDDWKNRIENFLGIKEFSVKSLDLYNTKSARTKQLETYEPFNPNHSAGFFDPGLMMGNSKFDIVIGNPPYIQLQKDGGFLGKMYEKKGYETFEKTGDIYSLFYEYSIKILKQGGVSTMITSNKWMRAGYGEKLRQYFVDNTNPLVLIDLGAGVFETATVDSNILILEKKQVKEFSLLGINLSKENKINDLYRFYNKKVFISNLSNENWNISTKIELNIKEKIKNIGTPLIKWDVKINYGIKTGYNEAFIIDGIIKNNLISIDKNSSKIIKKLIRGKDIKRYYTDSPDLWLIAVHNGYKKDNGDIVPPININDYPAIKDWLDRFYNELNSRSDKGITPYNLRNCAYQQDFEKNKVVWTPVNSKYSFSFVNKDVFFNNSLFMITGGQSLYFCAIFNSKLIRKYIEFLLGGEGDYSYGSKEIIEQIPIPKISPETQTPFIEKVDKILEITKQAFYDPKNPPKEQKDLEEEIDEMVYELYGLSDVEVRVVEESLK